MNNNNTPNINPSVLQNVEYGLYLVSAKNDIKDNACVVNTFMQVNIGTPTICSLAVAKQSLTHDMILDTNIFNISVLSQNADYNFHKHFGMQSGRAIDKFASFSDVSRSSNGLIYLTKKANSFLSLKVVKTIDLQTHTLFLAEITESNILNSDPSVTYAHYHKHIKPAPVATEKQSNGYRCTICNYFVETQEPLPNGYECPLCSHGVEAFVKE